MKKMLNVMMLVLVLAVPLLGLMRAHPVYGQEPADRSVDWVLYTDPYWGFSIRYPANWNLQNTPFQDFGFRISHPHLAVDPLGRPTSGASLAVFVREMTEEEWKTYKAEYQSEIQLASAPGFQRRGVDDGSPFVEWAVFAFQHLHRFRFVSASHKIQDEQLPIVQRMIDSLVLTGKYPDHPTPDYSKLLKSFGSFSPIKHAFEPGPGKIIRGYGPNETHYGSDVYALDVCPDAGCGRNGLVLAPSDIKLVWSGRGFDMPASSTDFHIFEISEDDNGNRLCMSLGHLEITLPSFTVGKRVPPGAAIGRLVDYVYGPHIHLGIWHSPPGSSCAGGSRTPIPYIDTHQLDGVNYPIGQNHTGKRVTSTNAPICAVPSGIYRYVASALDCIPDLPPPSGRDAATLVSHITIPDGAVLSANQAFVKTWRLRNSGTSTWGPGYQLAFIGGDQLGAPGSVNLPRSVAPGEEVDVSVNMTAPSAGGSYQGDWQMRNAQGVYFGDRIWVKISVPGGPAPTPPPGGGTGDIEVQSVEYPSVVTPGQSFRPRVTVRVNQGQLLESRGDMLRNTDGNLYGAWPHVAVVGTVNAGQTYTFEFYQNNPITAPSGEGTYESRWRVWRDGNWAGPEITIRFDVRSGGGTRPNPPTLVSPGNWHVSRDGSTPTLCASAPAGLQYSFQIYESHDIPESGWISSNCWTPPGLGPYGYQWHVKVRDPGSGLASDWSETWHFNIDSQELTMDDLVFSPGSPSAANEVRVYTCVRGFGGIGLGLSLYANTATDGSASGDWQYIHPIGTFCYNRDDPNTWPNWGTLPLENGTHLIRATGFHDGQTIVKEATYTLLHRRPDGTALLSPIDDVWLNDRTVTFRWGRSVNAQGYNLIVSTTSNRDNPDIFSETFGESDRSYTLTLPEDYQDVWWWLESFNDAGSNCCSSAHFGVDRVPPSSTVTALSPTTDETKFTAPWGGSDDRSGIRWYDVQYRDGDRGEWTDWQVNVTQIAAIFTGQPGHTYYFRARALDKAGNQESYPGGDGDTYTRVDPAAAPPAAWWNTAYAFKRNVLVLNNDSHSLPAGYPVHLHFDNSTTPTAGELYNASQSSAKGDDFRIVYNNQTELLRFVQTFLSDRIDIWFNLQAGIGPNPGSDSASYQLYYSNPNASSLPADPNIVFSPAVDGNTIGLWRFSEGSGTTIADSSGHGHTGSASNMGWIEGKFGWAGIFNGSNSVVNLGSANVFNLSTFTAEAWAYFTEVGGERSFFIKHADDGSLIYDADTDYSEILLRLNGNSCYVRSNRRVEPGRWYHLAWTYDGSTARVYINGELMNSSYCGNPLRTGNSVLWLGGDGKFNNKYVKGHIQLARMSNIARTSFPYGTWGVILQEPDLAVGDAIEQPQPGSPDLAVQSLAAYSTADGPLVQAVVTNQGDGATRNGFWIDLYADHQPTGPGDLTGSIRYWVASPIETGQSITLTTLLEPPQCLIPEGCPGPFTLSQTALSETRETLYVQADSKGTVNETNRDNNISSGVEVCLASADAFEADDTAASATEISTDGVVQTHNVHVAGDEDWFSFTATAGVTYTIQTGDLSLSADTYLYLYDTNAATLLAANDDYGSTLASQIEWQAPADGTYYVKVKHWNPNVGGCGTSYSIAVRPRLLGDLDGNCVVDVEDIQTLAGRWRQVVRPPYDFDGDEQVTVVDIMRVAAKWGVSCEEAQPPAVPSNLQATTISSTQIRLDWNANSTDEIGFRIYDGSILVATVGANTTSYTVEGLAPNSYHCFHIYAFNGYGTSDWTDWACATTWPACEGEPLAFEQRVTGRVDDTTPAVSYCIPASAGQWVSIRMFALPNSTLDTYLKLYAPDGRLVEENDDGANFGFNSFLTYQFPQSGYYRLETTRFGSSQGDYALRLEVGREAGVGDINRDCQMDTVDFELLRQSIYDGAANPSADLNLDGVWDESDYDVFAANFGRSCSAGITGQQKLKKTSPQ